MQCMAYLKMYNDMWIYREWNYPSGTHIIISKTDNKIKTFACYKNSVLLIIISTYSSVG